MARVYINFFFRNLKIGILPTIFQKPKSGAIKEQPAPVPPVVVGRAPRRCRHNNLGVGQVPLYIVSRTRGYIISYTQSGAKVREAVKNVVVPIYF